MIFEILVIVLIVVLAICYIIGLYNEAYWKKRGVKFYRRNKVTGLFWDYLFQNRSFFELLLDVYNEYPDEPAVAFGSFLTPSLYVKDLKNVQHITTNDFQAFHKRGFDVSPNDKLAQNVLLLNGRKWKLIRQKITPLFTTAKLRNMFYTMDKSATDFVHYLKENPERLKGNGFDTMNTYCCAAIAATVFGISTQSTFESPFISLAKEALEPTTKSNIKFAMANLSNSLFNALGLSLFSVHEEWFIGAIKKIIREREKEDGTIQKHDFADMCVSLQKQGVMKDPDSGYELEPTDEILAAQAFFYFLAGLEPCASGMFTTAVELGRNPQVLNKLHQLIDDAFEQTGGRLTYDVINKLEYLENVVNESLRMYPPIGFNAREAVIDTVLPVGNIKVAKGTKILMPIFEYMHDEQFYSNPYTFDPDRFSNGKKSSDEEYMPFGSGHRLCIGMRYSKMQMKTGLMYLLRHFTIKTTVNEGGIKYKKQQVQVRVSNVDIELVPRL